MAVALYPASNSTEFDLPHRSLHPMIRCREVREVRSVSCTGKLDPSRFDSLRSGGARCKPAHAKKVLPEAGFAGRLFSKAERSRKISNLEQRQEFEVASFEIFEEQLENFSFKYIYPEEYERLSLRLVELYNKEAITDAMKKLERALQERMIAFHSIYGREKSLYSIYKKMLRKNLSLDQIHDLHGIRLILETKGDCYLALDIINELWPRVVKFKDYIVNPKPNGYQSLHTVVMTVENIELEIQVRTKEMHFQAECGLAAHWRYKHEQGPI